MKNAPYESRVLTDKGIFDLPWKMWLASAISVLRGVQFASVASYYTPTTGFSIQVLSNSSKVILTPAGPLATGAVTLPATPYDGMEWRLSSTQVITALTLLAVTGQTIKNAPSTLAAGVGVGYTYSVAASTWYRLY